jgi:hypothetical protein
MPFTYDLAKDLAQTLDPQAFRTNLTYDSNAAADSKRNPEETGADVPILVEISTQEDEPSMD